MHEIPKPNLEKDSKDLIEKPEHVRVPIEQWARENNHLSLLRHIESSDKTDKNIGILRENIYYDPIEKTITLAVLPHDIHQGHSFEGTGIMLGGIPKVFIDVTSGALAFTEAPDGTIPLHITGTYENAGMIIQHNTPLRVVSSFEKNLEEDEKKLFIKTEVFQGEQLCVVMRDQVQILSERGAGALAKRRERVLDKLVEQEKVGTISEIIENPLGETVSEPREMIENKEVREERLVQELLQLVSSHPDFIFGISANGKLGSRYYSDSTATLGQVGYLFDSTTQQFSGLGNDDHGKRPDPLVYEHELRGSTLFEPVFQSSQQKIGQDEFIQFKSWIPLEYMPGNHLTSDQRPGLYFGGGLFIRNEKPAVEAVSEDLLKTIQSGKSNESREIFWKFLVAAFEKYTPDWWQYVTSQWEAQPGNKGKKIADFFQQK